ncbi:MAG: DNA repair ATPase, partial [Planctomycetota bacterium]
MSNTNADNTLLQTQTEDQNTQTTESNQLERSTYEIIRNRLNTQSDDLRTRLERLNANRRDVFGAIETALLASDRITTENNCVPRDMVAIGDRFIFGYNVNFGLKTEVSLSDVFAVHSFSDNTFHAESLELIDDPQFREDFAQVFTYYKRIRFGQFFVNGPHLYMVFPFGKTSADIKVFKWVIEGDRLQYVDARSEHEVRYPAQHEFRWLKTTLDQHREGMHPHVSIEDRIFVETVGGDLTIKVEDNTESGQGIYAEDVVDPDQNLADAEIFYSVIENIILLKIRPYGEEEFRYIVYSDKVKQARRVDAIENACVLLPESHGLIFSNGYYLQTGEYKEFESNATDLQFYRRVVSTNGEDVLFVFNNPESGMYVLLSYNVITQQVATPIVCHGYSLFDNGNLVFFKSGHEPQKHHTLQIWQTPFVGESYTQHVNTDSFLYKIGNPDIVRGMAECYEILGLIAKDDSYEGLYHDLAKKSGDVLDTYFWTTSDEAENLGVALAEIRTTASAAIDEFEKVQRVRRETETQFRNVSEEANRIVSSGKSRRYDHIDDFVSAMADLRTVRGSVIGLRELRFVDLDEVTNLDEAIAEQMERVSFHCVEFLLREDSLVPYKNRVEEQRAAVETVTKVAECKTLEEEIDQTAADLDMLIDVISNLKIDDATQRTEIIESISAIYARLNQSRAALKKHTSQLMAVEGEAEFHSQIKLLEQSVVNYLDVCDTPEKCDEYLTKMMVQIEELEGRFAEFEQFLTELADRRQQVYSAFDNRKVALVEKRNRRATSMMGVAERILKGIETRVAQLDEINDIHSYFAADLMVDKVRNIVEQLTELGDTVKVDDLQSRLKTVREDAIRQLKDRHELYVDGDNIIQLGRHRFSVNTQPLDLTTVVKEDQMYFHLTGTNYMEPITDEGLLETVAVWNQSSMAENANVYRAEYLAYQMLRDRSWMTSEVSGKASAAGVVNSEETLTADALLPSVQTFMASRHSEGYVKGVHDHDASIILAALLEMESSLGALRYPAAARALATLAWQHTVATEPALAQKLTTELTARAAMKRAFGQAVRSPAFRRNEAGTGSTNSEPAKAGIEVTIPAKAGTTNSDDRLADQVRAIVAEYATSTAHFDALCIDHAVDFLMDAERWTSTSVADQATFAVSEDAHSLCDRFVTQLTRDKAEKAFDESRNALTSNASATTFDEFILVRTWLATYAESRDEQVTFNLLDEAAAHLLAATDSAKATVLSGSSHRELTGLVGDHAQVKDETYTLVFDEFSTRIEQFEQSVVPQYVLYQQRKKQLVESRREQLRLDEFKPRVLTSFVRNRLIDDVYLPLVGDNLAKQIGVVGEQKRTDLMGLLLLVSPPGYGKTTLMEYIANRLGLTFMKINGPAIGHAVTSLDPAEAGNASAREEIEKLNLALEMGDNVMIYLDDIQHCNPEFLQKFISLCDAQRKIEGVFQGRTRRYDLRGRKVVVVMAGNPYTESGQKFQIPDMLASRADTYNLGDVAGGYGSQFALSYLENAITSNPTLSALSSRSQSDVLTMIKMAENEGGDDGLELEGDYSPAQITEYSSVIRKLLEVRDVVLNVNQMYIDSAAQADEYRTEPAFKLQGSYRDMNKMAEAVAAIMNDDELSSLIEAHYENQAQTLTSDAEANLLKLRELLGTMTDEQQARWHSIRETFQRNLLLGAAGDDKFARIVGQLSDFTKGLDEIRTVIASGMSQMAEAQAADTTSDQLATATAHLAKFTDGLEAIQQSLAAGISHMETAAENPAPPQEMRVFYRVPRPFLEIIKAQFTIMKGWLEPITK